MWGLASALYNIAVAAWVGSLLAIGYIAAPVLFSQLADRSMAGTVAGALFSVINEQKQLNANHKNVKALNFGSAAALAA